MNIEEYRQRIKKSVHVIEKRSGGRHIWLYGAGNGGDIALDAFFNEKVEIAGFVDRRFKEVKQKYGCRVISIDQLSPKEDYIVSTVVKYDGEIMRELTIRGFTINDMFLIATPFDEVEFPVDDYKLGSHLIGRYTIVPSNLILEAARLSRSPVRIGRFCSINSSAKIAVQHYYNLGSTASWFLWGGLYDGDIIDPCVTDYETLMRRQEILENYYSEETVVGNDVWIGANVVIMQGVKIGDGAVIGANAVVTKNVEPYSIVVGVPAKHLKWRFDEVLRRKLMEIKWWDWDIERIKDNYDCFYNTQLFLERF